MAFWDNWFKVECEACHKKFAKDELVQFKTASVCEECKAKLDERAAKKAEEVERRRLEEEAARAALLDRPIDTSGKPFGAGPTSGSGSSDIF